MKNLYNIFILALILWAGICTGGMSADLIKGNGANVTGLSGSRPIYMTLPDSTFDFVLWQVPDSLVITEVALLCFGGSLVGQLWEYDSNGRGGSTVDSDMVGVDSTTVYDDGTLSNYGIAARNWIGWKTDSIAGTPASASVTFKYRYAN